MKKTREREIERERVVYYRAVVRVLIKKGVSGKMGKKKVRKDIILLTKLQFGIFGILSVVFSD